MKKQFFSLLVGLITYSIGAQGINEMINYSTSDLNGTARFKSMSGAFGALGGDFTTLSYNPAGISLYQNSELSFTPSFSMVETNTSLNGNNSTNNKNGIDGNFSLLF